MACGVISTNLTVSCTTPVVGGVRSIIYLANFDQWQAWAKTYDGTNKLELETFTPATSEYLYKIEQPANNNVRPMVSQVTGDNGVVMFTHSVAFLVAAADVSAWNYVNNLCKGRFVAFVVTNNSTIVVLGGGTGLVSQDQEIQNSYANQGMFAVTLASMAETPEGKAALLYNASNSDFETALATLEGFVLP